MGKDIAKLSYKKISFSVWMTKLDSRISYIDHIVQFKTKDNTSFSSKKQTIISLL